MLIKNWSVFITIFIKQLLYFVECKENVFFLNHDFLKLVSKNKMVNKIGCESNKVKDHCLEVAFSNLNP